MKVSVIIPNYNYGIYLEQCIDSVFSQTYKNIECIVVNDGSTDESSIILNKLCERFSELVIIEKENGGLSSARNSGILRSTGDVIAFLDADDFWLPNKLANQIEALLDYDVVYSNYVYFDNNEFTNHSERVIKDIQLTDFISGNPILGSASSILIRKMVIQEVGFFERSLTSIEDLDYWFRCIAAGKRFIFVNSKDVVLRNHSTSMSKNYTRMYYQHLIVLERQFDFLEKYSIKLKNNELKDPLLERLSKIRWYAYQINRKDLVYFTFLFAFNKLKLRFLNKRNLLNILKTI